MFVNTHVLHHLPCVHVDRGKCTHALPALNCQVPENITPSELLKLSAGRSGKSSLEAQLQVCDQGSWYALPVRINTWHSITASRKPTRT